MVCAGLTPSVPTRGKALIVGALAGFLLVACDGTSNPTAQPSGPAGSDSLSTVVGLGCRTDAVAPGDLDAAATFPSPPTAGPPDGHTMNDYGRFGEETIAEIRPLVIGVPTDVAAARLRAAGWTITIGDATSSADPTMTPDLRWDRLVLVSCRGRVEGLAFD